MRIALIAIDKPGAQQIRLDNRETHLAYVAETGVVEMAGPFLDANGKMCGSLLILVLDSMEAAEEWLDDEPYIKADLFGSVTLAEWKKVIG